MEVLQLIRQFLVLLGRPLYLVLKFIFTSFTSIKFKPVKVQKKKRLQVNIKLPKIQFNLKKWLKRIYLFYALFPRISRPRIIWPNLSWFFKLTLAAIFLVFLSLGVYIFVFKDLPAPSTLTSQSPPLTTHILDRNGIELYKIYSSQNRTLVHLNDVPLYMRQATVAIEDNEFFTHPGFSVKGTVRAFWRNLTSGETVEGGSTITQQLVKTALLTPERTFKRKVRELVLAIAVEAKYSKDQILEMYLNRVGYGGTAYGVEEAAQTYFGKSSKNLTLAEAALLAGLPASPTTYSPFGAHPELAKSRQKEVLQQMVAAKYITQQQAEEASNQDLVFAPQATDIKAPHFVMYVKEQLEKKYGPAIVEQGGLTVVTSLDWNIQQEAQNIVAQEIAKVAYLHIGNGAAIVTNPQTGDILAMVGSKDYFDVKSDGNVNVTLSMRQPGSSIKPINYALAFMHGFSPSSIIDDSPVVYRTAGQPDYAPVNYDGKFHGRVPLRTALASSYNIPAVKLLAANGISNMVALAQKMGITTWTDPSRFGLSLTLGGGEVKMTDMATAYGVFANMGKKTDVHAILKVTDNQNRVLQESKPQATEVLSPDIAYFITSILSDNAARTPAFGPRSDLYIPNSAVAVKTGTTNNLRDNWTIGYTPNRLVAVWVGNNDNTPMSYVASGVTGASPIWRRIMDSLLKNSPNTAFSTPNDLVKANICTITGELACNSCPSRIDYFLPGTAPTKSCSDDEIKAILEQKAKQDQDKILNGAAVQR